MIEHITLARDWLIAHPLLIPAVFLIGFTLIIKFLDLRTRNKYDAPIPAEEVTPPVEPTQEGLA